MDKKEKYGIVYVIFNPEINILKIGVTKNINKRLKSLQCASGCDLKVLYSTPPISNFFEIELNAHKFFKQFRRSGEWFDITEEMALNHLKSISFKDVHPVYKLYLEGLSISKIAFICEYSRAYVIQLLKNWNVYIKKQEIIYIAHNNYDKLPLSIIREANEDVIINHIVAEKKECGCVILGYSKSGHPILKKCKEHK